MQNLILIDVRYIKRTEYVYETKSNGNLTIPQDVKSKTASIHRQYRLNQRSQRNLTIRMIENRVSHFVFFDIQYSLYRCGRQL